MFWRHKEKKHVLNQECYNKLYSTHQTDYEATNEQPTHKVEEDDSDAGFSIIETVVAAEILLSDNSSTTSDFSSNDTSSPDFGGGDFSGGGASGDF